ncbi:DNA-processing protein DprA [Nocardia puris]|uniref:DNA-processing protein DprA n=1 Tax=Nocardia puris TaxID=208602 RepID=UPI002B4B4352|nr:DNA-processing protein DprA [Nocardia puris]
MAPAHASPGWDDSTTDDQPTDWGDRDRAALIAMMRSTSKNTDWSRLAERVSDRGSAWRLWQDEHPGDLFGDSEAARVFEQALRDVESWKQAPFQMHTFMDRSYPERLRSVRQMPPVVFTRGVLVPREVGVCVVGSRNASDYALKFADDVSRELVTHGVTVISGLARGIDTTAHRAALEAGGRTVAVLGNGLDHAYPRENRELQERIAECGMLLTHFLPEYGPSRWSFPARNVTMSAYGSATVIVEAGEKSGTRIQAREAVAHGRPVILNSSVAQSISWGRAMSSEPGVHIAEAPADAIEHVDRILVQREALTRILGTR